MVVLAQIFYKYNERLAKTEESTMMRASECPVRPLGQVSDFVMAQLPTLLAEVRAGTLPSSYLAQRCEFEARSLSESVISLLLEGSEDIHRKIALLDLLFMDSASVHSGEHTGMQISSLVERFALRIGRIPAMTYGDLIFVNPRHDMRVFCNGEAGVSEKGFYTAQMFAEAYLADAAICCQSAIANIHSVVIGKHDGETLQEVHSALEEAATKVRHVADITENMSMALPVAHFAVIRKYFGAHPVRNYKGPSGVFSLGIFLIELMLAGDRLQKERPDYLRYYLEENTEYLRQEELAEAKAAYRCAMSGFAVFSLLAQVPSSPAIDPHVLAECNKAASAVSSAIRLFRGNHYKAVKHQIPDVLAGYTPGTGEADAGNLLVERMKIRHN